MYACFNQENIKKTVVFIIYIINALYFSTESGGPNDIRISTAYPRFEPNHCGSELLLSDIALVYFALKRLGQQFFTRSTDPLPVFVPSSVLFCNLLNSV